jgi:hypothetical protein
MMRISRVPPEQVHVGTRLGLTLAQCTLIYLPFTLALVNAADHSGSRRCYRGLRQLSAVRIYMYSSVQPYGSRMRVVDQAKLRPQLFLTESMIEHAN